MVWTREETIPRLCRQKNTGTAWDKKKKRKTKLEMDGLCQQRAIRTTEEEVHGRTGQNCVCRNDPTIKWERLDEESSLDLTKTFLHEAVNVQHKLQ